MILIKHNKKKYPDIIKYDTVPSLKEKVNEDKIDWRITDFKRIIFHRITEIKIETLSPLLLHVWITMKWNEKDKEKQYVLESYL